MNPRAENLISGTKRLPSPQKREVPARLWAESELGETGKIWKSVCFGENLRIAAYAPEQEIFIAELRELLLKGELAGIENEGDGACEIYGADRTFYVTMSPAKKFVGLLSSWLPFEPPKEINLEEVG
ncbi:MAG TPA: hypothetical protein VF571_10255 [Pyrinomonadaceae bacterium]|jgi:hypothetical protein